MTVAEDLATLRIGYAATVHEMSEAELDQELDRVRQRANGAEQAALIAAERRLRRGVRPVPTDAPGIVREAIATAGVGEAWAVEGINAARAGNRLFITEADELGWTITAYRVEGAEATPITTISEGHPVRVLAGLLRDAVRPMIWHRVRPGEYRSGGYEVGLLPTGEWFAEGPGVDRCFDHKHEAQAACDAARRA